MKIIVDAMGGDNAPDSIVRGALMAAEEFGTEICLVGRGEAVLKAISNDGRKDLPAGVEMMHADSVISVADGASAIMREKKDCSMAVGLRLLADGYGDAFISAGSTGALITGATLIVKRIKGIRRASLAPIVPVKGGKLLLIDCGANLECTPEYLMQFAVMGGIYAEGVFGAEKPRIGLLNIGTEPEKGGELQKESYKLLDAAGKAGKLNFVGNIESREAVFGCCDVLVADGYSGNIFVKSIEGMGLLCIDALKTVFTKNSKTKIAALMVQDGLRAMKKNMDYNEYGGAPLLGISQPVIKAHGSAEAYTFRSAIKQTLEYARSGIIEQIERSVAETEMQ